MSVNIEVRKKIIEVSRRKFFNFGIKRVTVDEIASELGIGKATLYEYFPSKNILVQAVMEEKRREGGNYLNNVRKRIISEDGLNLIKTIKELIIFGSNDLAEMKEPFLREVEKSIFPFSIELDLYDLIRPIIEEIITRGIREKVIRDDFNKQVFTEMVFCIVNDIISNQEFADKFNLSRSEVMETIVRIFVGGLLTDKGRVAYKAIQGDSLKK